MRLKTLLTVLTTLAATVSALPASGAEHGTLAERDIPSAVEERKVTEWYAKSGDCSYTWGGHCQAQCVSEGIGKKCKQGTVVSDFVSNYYHWGKSTCVCDCTV